MKNLNAVALSAVLVPALSLGSIALAADSQDRMQDREQHSSEMHGEQQQSGERYLSSRPSGGLHAAEIIGSNVTHRSSGEDIGEIQDLVIDSDGKIVGVVVTTGGFLGLGGRDVGLGWDHIEHSQEDQASVFHVDMEEEALRAAPEYKKE